MDEIHETRHEFFVRRLKELGMYDADSDYDGMIGNSIEELSVVFSSQGHSGMSANITVALFNKLMGEWDLEFTSPVVETRDRD